MKKIKALLLLSVLTLGMLAFAGCSKPEAEKPAENKPAETTQPAETKTEGVGELTKENPIQVNKEEGTITFLAQVNGKYFYESTRHGAVFLDGKNGEKAVFRGFVNHEDFYNALVELGAKAGENMTLDNAATTHVEGDKFDVTVNWTGAAKPVSLNEAIKDSNGKQFDIRFGGNLKTAMEKNTGCLICLDSCPVGITSNAVYTYGAVEKAKEVEFMGNKDVLPEDGTFVAVTMKLAK